MTGTQGPSSLRLIVTLAVTGLGAGLVLVGVYLWTRPLIARNRAEALRRAVFRVLPGCVRYETLALEGGRLVPAAAGHGGGEGRIYLGRDEQGRLVGFALPGEVPGFQDTIRGILGYDPGRKVIVGFQVLESRETPGLGDKIMKDPAFLANFTALAVEPEIEAVPAGKKTRPNQVETITGATISSKAVVRLLRETLDRWRPALEAYLAAGKGK